MKKSILLSLILFVSFACSKKDDPQPAQAEKQVSSLPVYLQLTTAGKTGSKVGYRCTQWVAAETHINFEYESDVYLDGDYTWSNPKTTYVKAEGLRAETTSEGDNGLIFEFNRNTNGTYGRYHAVHPTVIKTDTCFFVRPMRFNELKGEVDFIIMDAI